MKRSRGQARARNAAAQLRRLVLCAAIPLTALVGFELWRGPLPDRGASFALGVLLTGLGTLALWTGLRPADAERRDSPTGFLSYDRYRFLWLSAGLVALACGAYLFDAPPGGRGGGSWLGYGLGSACAAAMVWLLWFGVRKRSYASRGAPLRAWLSAHVYLGLALIFVMPLHSAFQLGPNVHTLALALAGLAIATGIAGLGFYTRIPSQMTRNRPGQKIDGLLEQIADLDARCRTAAAALPDRYARAVEEAIEGTRIGGGPRALLRGPSGDPATRRAIALLADATLDSPLPGSAEESRIQAVEMLSVKERLLRRVARDLRYKALLDLWLLVHVPVAFAAVVCVAVHVFVVFYYR